jgi:oligogalacturonide lyase
MKLHYALLVMLLGLPALSGAQLAQGPPTDWVEPTTGHRVIRLTGVPGGASFYFHQNAYTADGERLVVSSKGGFAAIDLTTLGTKPCKIDYLPVGGGKTPILGKKTRQLYYVKGGSIFATHIDTKETREVVKFPAGLSGASGLALNADETLLASTGNDPKAKELAKDKGTAGRSMCLFTVDVKTGEIKKIHYSTNWLNHTQFSPADPQQILFCHEGTWDNVDRIWTIRADGTGLHQMHHRTMNREIFGHEFFSADGKWIVYDLQTPRSTKFWLAAASLTTGERIRYKVEREHWSVHYNQSPDGKLFAGDGGGPKSVANRTLDGKPLAGPGNGQWIYLFTPDKESLKEEIVEVPAVNGGQPTKEKWLSGSFKAEKLVDLSKHDYKLEPNVTFTPDGKWIVFRSNMHGPTHVYAVEIKKSK